jgi:O-antigen/teichoic acid export membrane protein
VGGELLSKVASLAFYVFLARFLGRENFGDFTFALSLALLLTSLADLGGDQIMTREVARSESEIHHLFWNAILLKAVGGGIGVGVAAAVAVFGDYDPNVQLVVVILAFAVLLELIAKTVFAAFRAFEDMAPIASTLVLQRFLTAGVGITALALGGGVLAVSLIYLAGAAVALVYVSRGLIKRAVRPRLRLSYPRARWLALTALPIGVSGIFSAVAFRIDATMLSLFKGNGAVGLYGAAYRLLESTLFLSYAFVAAAVPTLSRLRRETTPSIAEGYETSAKVMVAVLLPLGVGFALFAEPVTLLLYGDEFEAATGAVRLLGGAAALYGISYLSAYVLLSQNRQRAIAWITGVVAVENILLNLVLIPRYSFMGAAFVTTVSEATLALLTVVVALRATGRVSFARIFSGPAVACFGMGAAAAVLGTGILGMVIAVLVYVLALVGVEHRLWPADLRMLADAINWRRAAA